jgi:hypothetical protein
MNKNPTIVLENQNLETYTKNQANSLYAQVRRQYGYIKPFGKNEIPNFALTPTSILVRQICFNISAGMRLGC